MNAHGTSTPLNDRSETEALKAALGASREPDPGLVDEVGDRPPARRRRRGRGDRDRRRARSVASRRRPWATASPTRASTSTTSRTRRARWRRRRQRRAAPRRDLQLVRLRRPQRGALPERRERRGDSTRGAAPAGRRAPARAPRAASATAGSFMPLRSGRRRRGRRRRRRRGRARRAAGVLLRAGPDASRAARSAPRTPTRSCACMRLAGDAGAPVVGFVESGGARLQEGHAALAGYGRIFRASVELSHRVPQVSIVAGVSAGGGAYSPALTDFVVMTEEARMFLTGPADRARGARRGGRDGGAGRAAVHGANGVCQLVAADVPDAVELTRELLSYLPRGSATGPRAAARGRAAGRRPGGRGARRPAPRLRRPRRDRGARRRRSARSSSTQRWARNMVTALRPGRGSRGRRRRQPAAPPRRRDRRRGGREGGAVRRALRPLRDPAGGAGRHARLHARDPAGGRRRDPLRRPAPARVRRRPGAEADRGPAQGVRRRGDHDELPGPRGGHGLRLARRRDRDHGRASGGRHRRAPPARRRRRPRGASRLARRASTRASTCTPRPRRPPRASSTR